MSADVYLAKQERTPVVEDIEAARRRVRDACAVIAGQQDSCELDSVRGVLMAFVELRILVALDHEHPGDRLAGVEAVATEVAYVRETCAAILRSVELDDLAADPLAWFAPVLT